MIALLILACASFCVADEEMSTTRMLQMARNVRSPLILSTGDAYAWGDPDRFQLTLNCPPGVDPSVAQDILDEARATVGQWAGARIERTWLNTSYPQQTFPLPRGSGGYRPPTGTPLQTPTTLLSVALVLRMEPTNSADLRKLLPDMEKLRVKTGATDCTMTARRYFSPVELKPAVFEQAVGEAKHAAEMVAKAAGEKLGRLHSCVITQTADTPYQLPKIANPDTPQARIAVTLANVKVTVATAWEIAR